MKLTAVIICRSRREKGFERALKSVEFADEILVEERREIGDFAAARNEALKKAKGEWVVFVDCDEEITPALAGEIQKRSLLAVRQGDSLNDINGFYFRRRDRFLGKWLKFGETASIRLLRLAIRDAGRWERPVHEVWKIGGRVGELKNPIWHYSHESVAEMLKKLDDYSTIEADYRLGRLGELGRLGKLGILGEMAVFPAGKFIQNYFLRLGFLDGMEGLMHALLMSGHSFLVRAKLVHKINTTVIARPPSIAEGDEAIPARLPRPDPGSGLAMTGSAKFMRIKRILTVFFVIAWVAGEAPRLWWKEAVPVRPMDAAAGLLFLAEIIGNKNYKSYKNIGLIIAALAGSWILGPYAARTLVYGWLIWRGGEIFSRARKWVAPAMASFLILGLGQYIFLPDMRFLLQYGWDEHYYRLIGTVLDPNYFGVMAGMILFFGLQSANLDGVSSTRSARNPRSLPRRRYLSMVSRILSGSSSMVSETPSSIRLLIPLAFIVLILTFSRASWLAFGLGFWIWFGPGTTLTPMLHRGARVRGSGVPADFSDEKSGYVRRRLGRLGILGILGILGVGMWWAAPKPGGEGVNLLRTASVGKRLTSWNQAIEVWKQNPWTGVGFKNYGSDLPSSSWLVILEATGIAGLGILGSLGILVIREIRGDRFWMAMAIMVGVHAVFNNTLFYPPVLGLLAMMRAVDDI